MSLKFCIIIESNSQKTFFAIVLYTNMAAVTSRENREFVDNDREGIAVQKPLTRNDVICQSKRMFRPHHDLKTPGTKSASAINTA